MNFDFRHALIVLLVLVFVYVLSLNIDNYNENFTEPISNIKGYDYKGCYVDKEKSRAIPTKRLTVPSLNACIQTATLLGYNTVGFQNENQCYMANDPDYTQYGEQKITSKCDLLKPGRLTNITYVKSSGSDGNNKN